MEHPVEVVLFDVGGVLVEVTGAAILRSWMGNRHTIDEIWSLWLRSRAVRGFETGATRNPLVFAAELVRELELPVGPEEFLTNFETWTPRLFPGTSDLILDLIPDVRRASLWNSNPVHWTRIMNGMGLSRCFHRDFASHVTGRIKPDREAFEYALAELDCRPERVLFVDDNQINVEAASSVGLKAYRTRGPIEVRTVLQKHGMLRTRGSS